MKITLNASLLEWSRKRAGLTQADLAKKLGVKNEQVSQWEKDGTLTFKQAEKLAKQTYTPFGYLFLEKPMEDSLPLPDFRTPRGQTPRHSSLNLLETTQLMQLRQAWMKEYLINEEEEPLDFVGLFTLKDDPVKVATHMRQTLNLIDGWANERRTWDEALRYLHEKIEEAKILIFFNGIVGNSTKRKLDPEEFQGFALSDKHAPLIFINNSDYKSAQMFTLAHELAHIWIGRDGVSSFKEFPPEIDVEQFCNKVAAEFLIPKEELLPVLEKIDSDQDLFSGLAREFKVSSIVVARRLLDLGHISKDAFLDFYEKEKDRAEAQRNKRASRPSGNFWSNQNMRVGLRFGKAVINAVREEKILYKEAYQLIGINGKTFDTFVSKLRL